MIIVFMRSLILYLIVIIAVRVMGKRQIGELQPSELVITILVSNIATLPLEDLNIPLITGVLPVLSLVCFEVLMSWLSLKSPKIRKLISGTPKVVIRGGVLDKKVLRDLRYSVDDLMTALRGKGVFDISQVQYAVVETNGTVSVYEKYRYRTAENGDVMEFTGGTHSEKEYDPPVIVVSDGKVITQALEDVGLKEEWLNELLDRKKLRAEDIFLLSADKSGKYTLIHR